MAAKSIIGAIKNIHKVDNINKKLMLNSSVYQIKEAQTREAFFRIKNCSK